MESVSSIPTLFLVAGGIFLVSVALLVIVLWLGRRWLVGPLNQLSQEVEQLKEAERQPLPSAQTGITPPEVPATEVSSSPAPVLIGLSDAQDSGSFITPVVHPEGAVKHAILSTGEGARIAKKSDPSRPTRIEDLTTDEIYEMYRLIHEQIKMGVGDISGMVVLYDTHADHIEIAYPSQEKDQASSRSEDKRVWSVVHTGQALHEITRPGGSWLGVPVRAGNEVVGALVIQDPQLLTGFDENAQHLLSNLAAQVAIFLRCRRLAESSRIQAEQGQSLASLTRNLWASSDRDAILRTALEEVGRSLHASNGLIQLEYSDDEFIGQGAEA